MVQKIWPLTLNFASGGVLLFFLVSGFVVAISVERQSFLEFGVKRFFRLTPVLWASMLIWILLNKIFQQLGLANSMPYDVTTLLANALLISDWMWKGYYDTALWILHTEVKFYLLMAGLIMVLSRLTLSSILGLAIFVSVLSMPMSHIGESNDFSELYKHATSENEPTWPFYFFSVIGSNAQFVVYMLIGSVICLWRQNRITFAQSIASSAALYLLYVTLHTISPSGIVQIHYVEDGAKAVIIFYGVVLVENFFPSSLKKLAFLSTPLSFLADISYPLYLIHGLIGMSIIIAMHIQSGNINLAIGVAAMIIFPLSWLLHRYVERPSQALGKKISENMRQFFPKLSKQVVADRF